MTDGSLHLLAEMIIEAAGFLITPFLVALVGLPLSLAYDWVRRKYWPYREHPERRAQREAWRAFRSEIEERTTEGRPPDPHEVRLARAPRLDDAALAPPGMR